MSLSRSLTDRGRVVRKMAAGGARVEGRTAMVATHDVWMPCRLVPGAAPETVDHGRKRSVQSAQIIFGRGAPDVRSSDTIEVDSPTLGRATWSIVAEPEVAVAGRQVRAVVVLVERVVEPTRAGIS